MTTTNDEHLAEEGIKLLKDVCVWMISVELATIVFLGSDSFRGGASLGFLGRIIVISFGLSVLFAAYVLSALPWIVLNLQLDEFRNFYEAPISSTALLNRVPVWFMAIAMHLFFGVGIVALLLRFVTE
jgi:hypothetical protein